MNDDDQTWLAGVDGCRGGWVVVFCRFGQRKDAIVEVRQNFSDIIMDPRAPAVIAVDMPIGLPDHCSRGGRAAEREVRDKLGQRRSSVFSTPSRRAVYAYEQGYENVCAIARQTSDPGPWAPSKQAFHIFKRIIQIDRALRENRDAERRVYEVHPELSFALMNSAPLNEPKPLAEPKKKRGRLHEAGLAARHDLLLEQGFSTDFLNAPPPRGAARDDFYDACATLWSAARIHARCDRAFPSVPECDAMGLPMAIRA
ncbi:MAG: DUF429 domain-containing protein [Methylovirgula sp.]